MSNKWHIRVTLCLLVKFVLIGNQSKGFLHQFPCLCLLHITSFLILIKSEINFKMIVDPLTSFTLTGQWQTSIFYFGLLHNKNDTQNNTDCNILTAVIEKPPLESAPR